MKRKLISYRIILTTLLGTGLLLGGCSEGRDDLKNQLLDSGITFDSSFNPPDGGTGQPDARGRVPDAAIPPTGDATITPTDDATVVGDATIVACPASEASPLLICATMSCGGVPQAELVGCVSNNCGDQLAAVSSDCFTCIAAEAGNGLQAVVGTCTDGNVAPGDASVPDSNMPDGNVPDGNVPDAMVNPNCGNGVVDNGEVCDYSLKNEDSCPEGWGLCRSCRTDCSGYLLRADDVLDPVSCATGEDTGADGTVEASSDVTFDAQGNITMISTDTDNDGTPDSITTATYNGSFQITKIERNTDGVGDPERIQTFIYTGGFLTQYEDDTDGNGTANEIQKYTNTAGGVVTRIEFDTDANGTADEIRLYTSNGNGDVTKVEYDTDASGSVDEADSYTYTGGLLTLIEIDRDNDGTPEDVQTLAYDANGANTGLDYDQGDDGSIDYRETRTFDAFGNKLTDTVVGSSVVTYTYDVRGVLRTAKFDTDADGFADWGVSYTSDANGHVTRADWDQFDNGSTEVRFTYGVGCLGTLYSGADLRETRP